MSTTALLFPGQGSQELGMGRSLAENSKDAMDIWKKAERISSLPLREIYWEGDDAAMADTRALQPALTVVNVSLWQALSSKVKPLCTAGHSLGEYASLAASGALDIDTTLELVSLRGRLMADADPHGLGAMAAVLKLEESVVQGLVQESASAMGETLLIANYNTPGQFVVSGTKAAVEHVLGLVKEKKGRAIALKVSGAFHSPLMAEAAAELTPAIKKASWNNARFAVYCNVHGRAVSDAASLCECMVAQMTSSVQWIQSMQNQWQDGARTWLEVGPKAVLSKMVAACLAGMAEEVSTHVVSNAQQISEFSL